MPEDPKFDVVEFSPESFYSLLENDFLSSPVLSNGRAVYIFNYLNHLVCKTIVVELVYTDGDYLEDYVSFYAKCITDYPRTCVRLHFFSAAFDRSEFVRIITTGRSDESLNEATLQDSYLGFSVIRALPKAIIGRTVLRTYPRDNGRRNYTCVRDYTLNLFGLTLIVPASLAFQEQDKVAAACATVALWSAFQKTSDLFGTSEPRPSVITNSATQSSNSRTFPSQGLKVLQICDAIKDTNLEAEVVKIEGSDIPLTSLLHGYLKFGLPVIVGAEIRGQGLHAITLTGFSIRDKAVERLSLLDEQRELNKAMNAQDTQENISEVREPSLLDDSELSMAEFGSANVSKDLEFPRLIGERIDEFYAHDDQQGPFSKLVIGPALYDEKSRFYPATLESPCDSSEYGIRRLYPKVLVIPAYNKIRVGFVSINGWVQKINHIFWLVFSDLFKIIDYEKFEWNIFLTTTNECKNYFRELDILDSLPQRQAILEDLLLMPHPRFIWQATLTYDGRRVSDFLFDATEVPHAMPLYYSVWYQPVIARIVHRFLKISDNENVLRKILTSKLFQHLTEKTGEILVTKSNSEYESWLKKSLFYYHSYQYINSNENEPDVIDVDGELFASSELDDSSNREQASIDVGEKLPEAEDLLKRDDVSKVICSLLVGLNESAMPTAKSIVAALITASLTGTIAIALTPIIIAAVASVVIDLGIRNFCGAVLKDG